MGLLYLLYLFMWLLTTLIPRSRALVLKLEAWQFVKKFLAFYGIRKIITLSEIFPYPESVESSPHTVPFHVRPILLLRSQLLFTSSSLSFRFPKQNSKCTYALLYV